MHLRLLLHIFLLSTFIAVVTPQFYRGDLEPRYSRKTPFRQQTEIPDPVFGIGHSPRSFGEDNSRGEAPFFGERREPERQNSGREDGRDFEANGEHFGRPRGFGRHGDEEEFDPTRGHDFKRPKLPDSSEVRERYDKERESRKGGAEDQEDQEKRPRGLGRHRPEDHRSEGADEEEEAPRGRPRPRPKDRNDYEEEEDGRRHRTHHEEEPENEQIAATPSKVVGLNMQMVAGVYPKEKKEPEVEDVERRGGRLVERPEERNKFFRGSAPEEEQHRAKGARDRRPAGGDSAEAERRERGERRQGGGGEGGSEERRGGRRPERPQRRDRDDEHDEQPRSREQGRGGQPAEQQQQQQAPPPPKPQIPPFPPFPKFPGFGGYKPYQPDFPSRSFGGDGGFASGPWDASGGAARREGASPEDVGSSEDRSGANRRRAHQPDTSSASSDDSSSHDESAERRNPGARHGKADARGGGKDVERREDDRGTEEPRREEHSGEEQHKEQPKSGEEKEEDTAGKKVMENKEQTYDGPKPEFPTPGRFVTNIRTKKSGEVLDATTAPLTTSTTSTIPTTLPETTTTGIVLPTESIATKLRSIVDQKIKVT